MPGFTSDQASAVGSSVPVRGDVVGKASFRLLGSRSTGGIALRGANVQGTCSGRGEGNSVAGGFPLPPPRAGTGNRERAAEGTLITSEEEDIRLGGSVEDCTGRGINDADGGNLNIPSTGRVDSSGLFVNTGTPGLYVSDWSLQSCDDADDDAVSKLISFTSIGTSCACVLY